MLPYSDVERALLKSGNCRHWRRVEIMDQAGAWQDIEDFHGRDWLVGFKWASSVDALGGTATLILARSVDGYSIEPLVESSPLNIVAGVYDPFLNPGGDVRWYVGVSTKTALAPIAWHLAFVGTFDVVDSPDGPTLELPCRDMGALLTEARIEDLLELDYPQQLNPPFQLGAEIEVVIQDILDAALGAGVVTLYTPVSPGVQIPRWIQQPGQLFEEIRKLALLAEGWDLRIRFDAGTGTYRLTFAAVDRTPGATVETLGPDTYAAIPEHRRDVTEVRNRVRVFYGAGNSFDGEDAASVALYGARPRETIQETSTHLISTLAVATALATAFLSDRSQPFASQRADGLFLPHLEVHDYVELLPTDQYDVAQEAAVVSVEHDWTGPAPRSSIRFRGKPASAYRAWAPIIQPTSVEIANYRGENLLAQHPAYNPRASYAYGESASILLSYVARIVRVGDRISASVMIDPTDAADGWRIALWFTDAAGALIGTGAFTGDLVTGLTVPTLSRIHGVNVPAGVDLIHVGILPTTNTPAGTATFDRVSVNLGAIAGLYVEPPEATENAEVDLQNMREIPASDDPDRATDGILFGWTPAPGVAEIHVYYGAEWPTSSSIPTAELAGSATEYRAAWPPAAETRYLEIRAIDAAGEVGAAYQITVHRDPASAVSVAGFLRARANETTSKIDLELTVDAGAFPVSVEIREGQTLAGSVLLATHSFAGAGTITKADYPTIGDRIIGENPWGWWAVLTDAGGIVTTTHADTPGVKAYQVSVAVLSEFTPDMGIIVHGSLQNAAASTSLNLDATGTQAVLSSPNFSILADGSVVAAGFNIDAAGNAEFDGDLNGAGGTFAGTITAASIIASESFTGVNPTFTGDILVDGTMIVRGGQGANSLSFSGGLGGAGIISSPGILDLIGGGGLVLNGSGFGVTIDGEGPVTAGAVDSGGAGFRQLIVPN